MEQRFSEKFAQAWVNPTPEKLVALLHPDVVLLQPHRTPVRGRHAALEEFRRLFAWLPQLHGQFDRAVEQGEWVFIEWYMQVPVGVGLISIPVVDRFRVSGGLGVERVVYFDQVALAVAVAKHQGLWLGFIKYRLGAGRK